MEPEAIYGGITVGSLLLGWYGRIIYRWAVMRGSQDNAKSDRESIRKYVIQVDGELGQVNGRLQNHMSDTQIHLVRGREDAIAKHIADSLIEIKKTVDVINGRCEKRQTFCGEHFGKIDSKLAAMSGNANGDDE